MWRGSGGYVNQSVILLADIDRQTSNDELQLRVQSHLVDLTEAYWNLYLARSELLLRLQLFDQADRILTQLKGRAEVDAIDRQIFRAEAAVANRRAEIARSVASVKNAESRLRLLINEPNLMQTIGSELLPNEAPSSVAGSIDMADAVATALIHRPDIAAALRELRSTNIRIGISKNDLLPKLDFLLGTYLAGLDGDSDFLNSWINQFKDGGPGYNVGLEFEVPLGNRAAKARFHRRRIEFEQSLQRFRLTIETALNEVEIALREVNTTYRELVSRQRSVIAARKERDYLIDRWKTLPGIDDSVTLLLEDLLESQERLAAEEATFARAQVANVLADIRLRQVMGTLFVISSQ